MWIVVRQNGGTSRRGQTIKNSSTNKAELSDILEMADEGNTVDLHNDEGELVLEEMTRNDLASGLGEYSNFLRLQIYFHL